MDKGRKKLSLKGLAVLIAAVVIIAAVAALMKADEPEQQTTQAPDSYYFDDSMAQKVELVGYPEYLELLFEKNKDSADFVLSYNTEKDIPHEVDMSEYENTQGVPLFIQWDKRWGYIEYAGEVAGTSGCGPVCLAMVGYYLTGDEERFSPDKVIEFAKNEGYGVDGTGTLWSLMSEGAESLGLQSEELYLSEELIADTVNSGSPVICIMGEGVFTSSGHFIVLTGYEDGYFTVNDSNSYTRSAKKWAYDEFYDQILNLWAISK